MNARFDKFLDARAEAEWIRKGIDAGLVVARERARRAGEREAAVAERNSIVLASKRMCEMERPQNKDLTMANLLYKYRKCD